MLREFINKFYGSEKIKEEIIGYNAAIKILEELRKRDIMNGINVKLYGGFDSDLDTFLGGAIYASSFGIIPSRNLFGMPAEDVVKYLNEKFKKKYLWEVDHDFIVKHQIFNGKTSMRDSSNHLFNVDIEKHYIDFIAGFYESFGPKRAFKRSSYLSPKISIDYLIKGVR